MSCITVPGTLDSNKGLTHINLCIPYIVLGCLPQHDECPVYDTKYSDGEVPVMLELSAMWSTSSFLSLPGPLWEVEALDRALSMG